MRVGKLPCAAGVLFRLCCCSLAALRALWRAPSARPAQASQFAPIKLRGRQGHIKNPKRPKKTFPVGANVFSAACKASWQPCNGVWVLLGPCSGASGGSNYRPIHKRISKQSQKTLSCGNDSVSTVCRASFQPCKYKGSVWLVFLCFLGRIPEPMEGSLGESGG